MAVAAYPTPPSARRPTVTHLHWLPEGRGNMNAVPIALFWALAVWGMLARKPVLIYLFFATIPVGAFAVIPTTMTGGLTFTPSPIVALLIITRTFLHRDGTSHWLALALLPQNLMLLFLFWITAAITTLYMPRIFENVVMVVPIRGILSQSIPLRPTTQNLSQFTYLTISVFSVFAFAHLLQSPKMRQHALQALCLGGAIAALTGLLDYASQFVPLAPLLAPFRTASYALMTDVEVLGSKRVVGLMPEASAYGACCLGFLSTIYFYRRAIINDLTRRVAAALLLALLALCAWLSTSSGTYVGLGILAIVAALEWLLRANLDASGGSIYRCGLGGELFVVLSFVIGIALLTIIHPQIVDPIYTLIDRMVLQKESSVSFVERGMWRSVAFSSLFGSHGFGVGLGATRASSSLMAIFSSTGIIGGLMFYSFVLQTLLRRAIGGSVEAQLLLSAFRFSFIPTFVVTLMVGDADFGGLQAFGFGITTAVVIAAHRAPFKRRHLTNPVL